MDERIKRAAKNYPVKLASANRLSTPSNATPIPSSEDVKSSNEEYEEENDEIPESPQPPVPPQSNEL